MNQNNFFVKNKSIITFLVLEIVALTAFNFGNISYLFGLAGGILAIVGIPFLLAIEKNKKELLWALLPMGILLCVTFIGSFNGYSERFPTIANLSLLVSLPAFFFLGIVIRKLNDVKPKTVLLVIGAALGAITLFGLVSTIIEYGPFYSLIYKNKPNYYYNGAPYNVTKEMYWLIGFEFGEVFVEYGSLFAILCSCFLFALLFLSPKEERNEFIICALIGGLGLLTLLVIPNLKALLILVIISLFSFVYKYLRHNKKVLKILGILFVVVIALGILFFILALVNAYTGFKFSGILNRIFVQNGIMIKTQPVFETLFKTMNNKMINLFGLDSNVLFDSIVNTESNIFEVELLKEVGLFGTFIFISFIIVMGVFLNKYIKHSSEEDSIKVVMVSMLLTFFVFETVFNVISFTLHMNSFEPFLRSPLLLVIMFMFGFAFSAPKKEEEKNNE